MDTHKEAAANFDELLSARISGELGKGAWSIADLRGRLTCVTDKDRTSETWCLDGRPIMQTLPPQVAQVMNGRTIRVTVTQPYRMLSGK